jgi:hypothetical protein
MAFLRLDVCLQSQALQESGSLTGDASPDPRHPFNLQHGSDGWESKILGSPSFVAFQHLTISMSVRSTKAAVKSMENIGPKRCKVPVGPVSVISVR